MTEYSFSAELWRWEAKSAEVSGWIFVTMPADLAEDVRMQAGPPRGFGSVRVEVRVGSSVWRTSLFPSADADSYVLPIKKAVRVAEGIDAGSTAEVVVRLVPS